MKKDWKIKKLGEVSKINYGYTEKASAVEIGPKFLRITDIQEDGVNWETVPYCMIFDEDFEKYKLNSGDIVFARTGATTGKSYLIKNPPRSVFASYLIKVKINSDILYPEFLYQYFQTKKYWDAINDGVTGSAQGGFNATKLSELEIPIPPLPEQHRIVSILDQAFAAIDKAKQNTEQNLKNARELFESCLQGVFENGKWESKNLKEITSILGDGLHGTPTYTVDGEYFFINGNNLNDGKIEFKETTKRVNINEFYRHKKNLNSSTVLVSINGTLGNVAFYNDEKIILGKSACYFNLKSCVDKRFVRYIISSPYFIKYAHRVATGATIKNVSLKSMREFRVPLPPLEEQEFIVNKLDSLSAQTKKLEAIYQQKLVDLEELKKSLLQKAFNGELDTSKNSYTS